MESTAAAEGSPPPDAEREEVLTRAREAIARFEAISARFGLTPETCLDAVRQAGGEQAVEQVRRAADEKLMEIQSRIARERLHTPPKIRVSARMRTNTV